MSEVLSLVLPDELAARAREFAARSRREVGDVVLDWIRSGADEPAVEALPDDGLLLLCDSMLSEDDQRQMSDLLARQREGALQPADRSRLDQLLSTYRRGLLMKARALKEAVSRGLKPPLANDAA